MTLKYESPWAGSSTSSFETRCPAAFSRSATGLEMAQQAQKKGYFERTVYYTERFGEFPGPPARTTRATSGSASSACRRHRARRHPLRRLRRRHRHRRSCLGGNKTRCTASRCRAAASTDRNGPVARRRPRRRTCTPARGATALLSTGRDLGRVSRPRCFCPVSTNLQLDDRDAGRGRRDRDVEFGLSVSSFLSYDGATGRRQGRDARGRAPTISVMTPRSHRSNVLKHGTTQTAKGECCEYYAKTRSGSQAPGKVETRDLAGN